MGSSGIFLPLIHHRRGRQGCSMGPPIDFGGKELKEKVDRVIKEDPM